MAGLYVHIPFCHSKCAYCDFFSVAHTAKIDAVTDAILCEYKARLNELGDEPIKTLYLGGGTPSILPQKNFSKLAKALLSTDVEEFTIEVNPEDVTLEAAKFWLGCGVNRVSMGVQSFIDNELKAVRRRHSAQQAIDSYHILREAGFKNISLDLIFGLPEQTIDSWSRSVDMMMNLRPEHFSAYILSIEPGTLIYRQYNERRINLPGDEVVEQMYDILTKKCAQYGYQHYEISNYSLPGYNSRHNSSYWESVPYLGLGPSAHSYTQGTRKYNPSDIAEYCQLINDSKTAFTLEEETADQQFNDLIITHLRTSKGLSLNDVPYSRRQELLNDAAKMIRDGLLVYTKDERLVVPEKHFIISDSIFIQLMKV